MSLDSLFKRDPMKAAQRRMDRSLRRANRADDVMASTNETSEAPGGGFKLNLPDFGNVDFAGAGLTALSQAPQMYQAYSTDPSEAASRSEFNDMQTSKEISLASSGAQIGNALGGPFGGAVGAMAGYGLGRRNKVSDAEEFVSKQDELIADAWGKVEKERLQNFYDISNSERIESELELLSKQQGYYNT